MYPPCNTSMLLLNQMLLASTRIDREKVKIEEMKLDTLERERARLENLLIDLRQRVDREREELKRVETLRLEEMRRASTKRPYESSRGSSGRYDDGWDSKRPAPNDRCVMCMQENFS